MWKIVLIPVVAVLALWTWQFLNWAWLKPKRIERRFRKEGMKGSPYKFLFGDSKEVSRMYEEAYSKPIGLKDDVAPRIMPNILQSVQKYGDYSFTWAGPRPRIFINDHNVAREVLNNRHSYKKTTKISNKAIKLLITGLAYKDDEEWVKARSRISPCFNLDRLKPMVPATRLCCEDVLNGWNALVAKGGGSCVIDVSHEMQIFTSEALAQLMFSKKYTDEIKKTFLQLSELGALGRLASKLFTMPGEQFLPTKTNRRINEIDKYTRSSLTTMINERLERNKGAPSGDLDLLDMFMEELYDGKPKTEKELKAIMDDIIGECKIFFFAGYETNSNTLTWILIYLAIYTEWQDRAREEVFQVLGNKKEVTSEDLGKLKIVTMIANEVLRLYPQAMEISRVVAEDMKINGYTIPKDAVISFPVLLFQRSTKIWGEDAGEFRPDRFAEGTLKAANGKAAYMPFGWGPRICIGMNFAMLETKTFLATLLRKFSFEISPTYTHAPAVAVTVHPQYGAPIVLKRL